MVIPNLRESSCAGENNLVAGSHAGVGALVVVLERDHEVSNKKRLSQLIQTILLL